MLNLVAKHVLKQRCQTKIMYQIREFGQLKMRDGGGHSYT